MQYPAGAKERRCICRRRKPLLLGNISVIRHVSASKCEASPLSALTLRPSVRVEYRTRLPFPDLGCPRGALERPQEKRVASVTCRTPRAQPSRTRLAVIRGRPTPTPMSEHCRLVGRSPLPPRGPLRVPAVPLITCQRVTQPIARCVLGACR